MGCKFCEAEETSDVEIVCFDEDGANVTLSLCGVCIEGRGFVCPEHGPVFLGYDTEDQVIGAPLLAMSVCLVCCAAEVDRIPEKELEQQYAFVCSVFSAEHRESYETMASDLGYGERAQNRRLIFGMRVEAYLYDVPFELLVWERSQFKGGAV